MRGNAPFSPLFLEHMFTFECSCDIIINSYITGLSTIKLLKVTLQLAEGEPYVTDIDRKTEDSPEYG